MAAAARAGSTRGESKGMPEAASGKGQEAPASAARLLSLPPCVNLVLLQLGRACLRHPRRQAAAGLPPVEDKAGLVEAGFKFPRLVLCTNSSIN